VEAIDASGRTLVSLGFDASPIEHLGRDVRTFAFAVPLAEEMHVARILVRGPRGEEVIRGDGRAALSLDRDPKTGAITHIRRGSGPGDRFDATGSRLRRAAP
jgi:hypothetical protein